MTLMISMFNYSDIGMLDMLANVSVVLFVGITFLAADWVLDVPDEMRYLFVFMMMCILSVLYSTAQADSMNRIIKLLIMMMELLAVYVYARGEDKDFILKVIAMSTAITAVYINIKGFEVLDSTKRVNNITGNSNQVSAYLALGILVMIYLILAKKMRFWLPAAGIIASVLAIIIQGSRTGILVAGSMAMVEVVMLVRYEELPLTKRLGLFMILILIMTVAIYYIISDPLLYMALGRRFASLYEIRTTGSSSMNETSVFKRALAYKLAFGRFMENPFLGKGIDSFSRFSLQSELSRGGFCPNNYLELLQGVGLIGTAAFYCVYISIFRKANRIRIQHTDSASVMAICILTAMLISHITVVFYYQKLEYIYLGILLSIAAEGTFTGIPAYEPGHIILEK